MNSRDTLNRDDFQLKAVHVYIISVCARKLFIINRLVVGALSASDSAGAVALSWLSLSPNDSKRLSTELHQGHLLVTFLVWRMFA
jgi:hypothetical protein